MVESIHELRRRVQHPVRAYNDVAGVLVGDRVSIHVTRLFLALGLSPTVATIGMLVCGLAGSALLAFGGGWAVLGFALLFAYYVLDCVDGEVARYRKIEKLAWGFHDYLFHLYVKAAFFVGLGVWMVRTTERWWTCAFALAALLATFLTKALYDAVLVLTTRLVIQRSGPERERFLDEVLSGTTEADLEEQGQLPGEVQPFKFGSPTGLARAVLTNFDLSILWFLAAAVIDLYLVPFEVAEVRCDLKCALLAFYGVVLPLDFLDRLVTYLRTGGFHRDARHLLRRAHQFRLR